MYAPQPAGYDYATATQPYDPGAAGQPAPGADQLALLVQALQNRQVPPLPGTEPAPAPVAAPAAPQMDGLALLRLILSNPQVLQALQPAAPRTVSLAMPAFAQPSRTRQVSLPIGAVVNTLAQLMGPALTQLNEDTSEDDPVVPPYLVSDDGDFIVDPTRPEDRAALVALMFRVDDATKRVDGPWQSDDRIDDDFTELDESDTWAREAGFM